MNNDNNIDKRKIRKIVKIIFLYSINPSYIFYSGSKFFCYFP